MTEQEKREAARQFWYKWNGKGKEDEDARSYWIDILQDILGMDQNQHSGGVWLTPPLPKLNTT